MIRHQNAYAMVLASALMRGVHSAQLRQYVCLFGSGRIRVEV
jgi:hypothetical protein